MSARWPRVASLRTPAGLRARLAELELELPCDDAIEPAGPSAEPLTLGAGLLAPNRFAVHPMEGWDGTTDGLPDRRTPCGAGGASARAGPS